MADTVVIEGKGTNDILRPARKTSYSRSRVRRRQGTDFGRRSIAGRLLPVRPALQRASSAAPQKLSQLEGRVRRRHPGGRGRVDRTGRRLQAGNRALLKQIIGEAEPQLRAGMLTCDARMKERKKYGSCALAGRPSSPSGKTACNLFEYNEPRSDRITVLRGRLL